MTDQTDHKDRSCGIDLVVIGGVGYSDTAVSGETDENTAVSGETTVIKTPYGNVEVSEAAFETGDGPTRRIVMISRHQGKYHTPPSGVNYRALISAAAEFHAPVLSINSVGTMKGHAAGSFFVPDDFIDMTKGRKSTFYEDEAVHTDMSDPYCRTVRKLLKEILTEKKYPYSEGVYIATEGPRFETKAEIRMYAAFADVVGMTGVPEVCLAKEAGLCYASLCLVTNPACGTADGERTLTAEEVKEAVADSRKRTAVIIKELLRKLPDKEDCGCRSAADAGRM